ncbi:MAG: glycosyl hydrolase, partial [Flavobacteriaceae bacterium]|nr:glycosyl hydrolase [Flavobacteriaceae bacterium]
MKKTTFIILLFIPFLAFSQATQNNAPWMKDNNLKKKGKLTLNEISTSAENFFKTIDRDKKGSGLKPFKRWEYHWSHFTKSDGTIAPASELWSAWKQKNTLNSTSQNNANDTSNWTSLGPYSHTNTASWSSGQGRVNVVTIDPSNPNTYYVGAPAGGIWKSTDAGVNWQPLTDYLPQIGVSGIAVHPTDPNTIYIATGDDDAGDSYAIGVMKTTDGGATWNSTGTIPGNPNSMNDIYIDSANPNKLMLATSVGVFKSADGGGKWTSTLSGNIIDLKMKPGNSTIWYAATSNTVYRSSDSGNSFSALVIPGFENSTRIALNVTPANTNYVYFVSSGNILKDDGSVKESNAFIGIYKSTNSGITFAKTAETDDIFESSQAWYDLAFTVSDSDPNILYVGVLNIWKSVDGGNNFSKMNNWSSPTADSYTHADIHFLSFINGKFFAGTDGGVYVSTNHGAKFTDLTENLAISQFYKISVSKQNSGNIVGGLQDNGGYAYKDNKWSNYFGADGMDCAINSLNPDNYFGFIQYGGSLYETADGGLTRQGSVGAPTAETGPGDSGGRWVTPLVSNSKGEMYAGYSQLYKLVNGNWSKISDHF